MSGVSASHESHHGKPPTIAPFSVHSRPAALAETVDWTTWSTANDIQTAAASANSVLRFDSQPLSPLVPSGTVIPQEYDVGRPDRRSDVTFGVARVVPLVARRSSRTARRLSWMGERSFLE